MEALTWTGAVGDILNPATLVALFLTLFFAGAIIVHSSDTATVVSGSGPAAALQARTSPVGIFSGGVFMALLILAIWAITAGTPYLVTGLWWPWMSVLATVLLYLAAGSVVAAFASLIPESTATTLFRFGGFVTIALVLCYIVAGVALPPQTTGIIGAICARLLPVWIVLVVLFVLSFHFKRRLGLYGKLFDSPIGMIGFALVMFWVFTGIFGAMDLIVTHDPLSQIVGMQKKLPGTPLPAARAEGEYPWYLFGGDNLARDVFSRLVAGAWIVVQIAPLATLFAFMVGITLGLPAGYFGGKLDTFLSFLANLILAFPVILLFYLLVTPEIVETGVPAYMGIVLFVFPVVFIGVLLNSRYHTQPKVRTPLLIVVLGVALWLYLQLVSANGWLLDTETVRIPGLPAALDLFDVPGNILVVFVSVVFVNSPTVFRIVRGLTLDIKTRDYVAAAQTRGEGPWYIMLWEILPNARGPLIVDFCLRIGYTTILLGTLGFFGLGLESESPDWGMTINEGRKLLQIYLHPALPPAFALLSLVLGLNLLADGLREESLRD